MTIYQMEMRIVVKIEAQDIMEANKKAAAMHAEIKEKIPELATTEYGTNFSVRPYYFKDRA